MFARFEDQRIRLEKFLAGCEETLEGPCGSETAVIMSLMLQAEIAYAVNGVMVKLDAIIEELFEIKMRLS